MFYGAVVAPSSHLPRQKLSATPDFPAIDRKDRREMTLDKAFERIDSLEIVVTEQQQVIDDLNEMITKQWHEHDLLKLQISKMTDQLHDLEENQPAPANQKAPHY